MLSLSELNCRIFQEEMVAPKEAITKGLDKAIKEGYPDIWSEMQEKDVQSQELCDYVTWSYFNAVPLKGDSARQDEYFRLATETCPQESYNKTTQEVLRISEQYGNLVSSGFLSNIVDKVNIALA